MALRRNKKTTEKKKPPRIKVSVDDAMAEVKGTMKLGQVLVREVLAEFRAWKKQGYIEVIAGGEFLGKKVELPIKIPFAKKAGG